MASSGSFSSDTQTAGVAAGKAKAKAEAEAEVAVADSRLESYEDHMGNKFNGKTELL